VNDEALPELYDAMDLFILPTQPTDDPYDVEGFGIVFLEAAARGVPAIGSPIGGVPDAVADGETGMLVAPDPDAIAEAIEQFRSDPEMRDAMARRARERVEESFTWPRVFERFAAIAGL
jgi:phosphatidylinositol alpha-1,6-mannosyltransferase